jgi:hypothetical protein
MTIGSAFTCMGEGAHGIWLGRGTERGKGEDGPDGLAWFFRCGKGEKGNRVHRKRVAKIKHGRGQGCNSDRTRER